MSQTRRLDGGRVNENKLNICVLDDSQKTALLFKNHISKNLSAEVTIYLDGDTLLKNFKAGKKFDIYILDYQLDRYGRVPWGDELARDILAIDPKARIIILASDAHKVEGIQEITFIRKSAYKQRLVKVMQTMLAPDSPIKRSSTQRKESFR